MDESCTNSQRDPSFLLSREPCQEPWKKPIYVAPKNLFSSLSSLVKNEQYKVFLRIKPNGDNGNNTHVVIDEHTILTTVPKQSVTYKVLTSTNSSNLQRKFGFSSVLEETASQNDVFKECVVERLKSLLCGEDSLIMAFGTTSAGKTFTMQGTGKHPGIIPRALNYLFRNLDGKLDGSGTVQPYRGTQLLNLSPADIERERTLKNQILFLDLAKYQKSVDTSFVPYKLSYSSDEDDFRSEAFGEIESQIDECEDFVLKDDGGQFSVWMSMIEIYNENIIDLLQFPNERGARPSLCLGEDDRGGFFVKNAQQIHVRNSHEAYQVSQFGRTNLHRAPTALNDKSSRSHCVLTVTLVCHQKDSARHSKISFVDLAGSERVKKTLNDGKRLVESKSINKSLSVLGKCLEALKVNQSGRPNKLPVPIRDSKMTKLFKNALVGVEKLSFIINISTDPLLFDETLHVLKFSALAQEVVSKPQTAKPATRFSQIFHSDKFRDPSFAWSTYSSTTDLTDRSDDYVHRWKKLVDAAEKKISDLERANRSYKCEIDDLENQLCEADQRAEELKRLVIESQQDIKSIQQSMNKHVLDVIKDSNKQRELDMAVMRKKLMDEKTLVGCLQNEIKDLKAQNKKLRSKMKVMVDPADSYDAAYQKLADENAQLRSKEKKLQALLDEAAEEYGEGLKENDALKKEIEEQLEKAVENECLLSDAEDRISELEAALREAQVKLDTADGNALTDEEKLKINELEARNKELFIANMQQEEIIAELRKQLENVSCEHDAAEIKQVIIERDSLKNRLEHEKSLVESLESECRLLRSSVKNACQNEDSQRKEIAALQAAVQSLEEETKLSNIQFKKQLTTLSEEKAIVEQCYISSQDEIRRLREEIQEKEVGYQTKLKSMEADLVAVRQKLEVVEYQKKVFETLKEKSDADLKLVPELKETIERLQNELINKDQEFTAFENGRKFLVSQHELEVEKYEGEIARLRKEVEFGRNLMMEKNAKHDVKLLQDELTTIKMALRDNLNDRSPLSNRTNILVPIGRLVDITPYGKPKKPEDEDDIPLSRVFCSLDNLTENNSKTPVKLDNAEMKSPQTKAKSMRKPRTAKKRDPADHPALSRSTRGHRRSVSLTPPPRNTNSTKKKLFSCEEFVEASDEDLFVKASPKKKRNLRPRATKI